MKATVRILLAGTALPLLALPPSAAPSGPDQPLVVAQALPGEAPGRARPDAGGGAEPGRRDERRQERGQERQERGQERQERAQERGQERQERAQEGGQERQERAQERGQERQERAQDRGQDLKERAQDRAQDLKERAQDRGQDQKERAQDRAQDRGAPGQAPGQRPAQAPAAAPGQPAGAGREERRDDRRQDRALDRPAPGQPPAQTPAQAPSVAPGQPAGAGREERREDRRQDRALDRAAPGTPAQTPAQAPSLAPGQPAGAAREERRDQRPEERAQDRMQQRDDRTRQGDADGRRRDERFAPGVTINVGREPRIDELRGLRRERTEGGRVIIEEPGDRRIIREGNRTVIIHDETDRFRRAYGGSDVRTERRGREEVTIVRRPNGVEIVTVRDDNGNLIRRVRRESGRRDVVLIENEVRGGPRRTIVEEIIELPPPAIRIPREKYVVEVERASQEDLYEAFTAPPVDRIDRSYTLEEIRRSPSLRERVRRVDVDTVTFDFGSWTLAPEQVGALTGVANAIRRTIERNPDEIFLIEGHTDAVGNDIDNLTLSDRRAETVAMVLSERFQIPPENLTTQGYGEQFLKVNTQDAERENRRVTVRRITPLLRGQETASAR
jgi:outer membrane protein OmpA-like peptidoglycan-associated protein